MRQEDKVLLVRAAIGVVLRRDLSLSRRLYTWLLGASDSSEQQIDHLRTHGLDLLRLALKSEMDQQSTEMETLERQRPFKIFISLLDKWEIGGVLTEVLVLDAFASLKRNLRPEDDHDEVSQQMLHRITVSKKLIRLSTRSSYFSPEICCSKFSILSCYGSKSTSLFAQL